VVRIAKTYRDVVENLVELSNLLFKLFQNSGNNEPDYRATIFLNIKSIIVSGGIIGNILLNVEEGKIPAEAYTTLFGLKDDKIQKMGDNLSKFTRLSLVTLIHFQIENLFVNLLGVLKPESKIPRGYERILKELFACIRILDKDEKIKTLKILQAIRNSLHSNGIHNNKSLSKQIDGFKFDFERGHGVTCANWDGIIIAIKATAELVDEIIKTPEIIKISGLVSDQHIESENKS